MAENEGGTSRFWTTSLTRRARARRSAIEMKKITLLLILCIFSVLTAEEGIDPFTSPPLEIIKKKEAPKLEVWMYTIFEDYPRREAQLSDYKPFLSEYNEEMNATEMEWFRFFQVL